MSEVGEQIDTSQLKPGNLVFFNTMRRAFSHVGIYLGDNHFMHAPRTGAEVRVESMESSYWMKRYNGARGSSTATERQGGKQAAFCAASNNDSHLQASATPLDCGRSR